MLVIVLEEVLLSVVVAAVALESVGPVAVVVAVVVGVFRALVPGVMVVVVVVAGGAL